MSATATMRKGRTKRGEPVPFDFRRPTTLSREHVRSMQIVHETLARGFSTTWASTLRAVTNVSVAGIDQRPYDEYVRDLPNPTLLTMLTLRPIPGTVLFQMPLPVAFAAVDLLLGGSGSADQPKRSMTELELSLVHNLVELTMPDFRYAFESVVDIEPAVTGQEMNPQFAQLAAPTDMVLVVSYDLKIDSVQGTATLCMPFANMQPHLDSMSENGAADGDDAEKLRLAAQRLDEHLQEAPIEVGARFRSVIATSKYINDLEVGDVIPLSHPVDEPLALEAEGVATHQVMIGRRNRRLAVQVVAGADPSARHRRPVRIEPAPGSPFAPR